VAYPHDTQRIKRLADLAARFFYRDPKTNRTLVSRDDAPEWVKRGLIDAALYDGTPDGMSLDDWRYEQTPAILEQIRDTITDAGETDYLNADVYTHELTAWLGSRNDRMGYVDEIIDEWRAVLRGAHKGASWPRTFEQTLAEFPSTFELIASGQAAELREMHDSIFSYLSDLADELAYTDDDPIEDCRPSADDEEAANADL